MREVQRMREVQEMLNTINAILSVKAILGLITNTDLKALKRKLQDEKMIIGLQSIPTKKSRRSAGQ